jgi:hypothetical protein
MEMGSAGASIIMYLNRLGGCGRLDLVCDML